MNENVQGINASTQFQDEDGNVGYINFDEQGAVSSTVTTGSTGEPFTTTTPIWNSGIGGAPYWQSAVYNTPEAPKPAAPTSDEIKLREKAIRHTLSLFEGQDVGVDAFCVMLEGIYDFLRTGVAPKIVNKTTINTNE
jgi:hypothetical protein